MYSQLFNMVKNEPNAGIVLYNNYTVFLVSEMASCCVEERFAKKYKHIKETVALCKLDFSVLECAS